MGLKLDKQKTMKKLPIGKQDFATLISNDYIYVDKTEIIYKLITTGSSYFFSRPRRFGKSLTLSTLKEIFSGNKDSFKGLWIYDKIDWKKYPIIHLDFSLIDTRQKTLDKALSDALTDISDSYKLVLKDDTLKAKFDDLINQMSVQGQVVILIDEYDKPIIDFIEDIPKAEENRDVLKNFYSVLKGNDANIKFLFITGVSKFSKVSIFSDLNHLDDITLTNAYSTLAGYTETELDFYFPEYLKLADDELSKYIDNVRLAIKNWYNGYSWNGKNFVYNPFSLLCFFANFRFEDFWFKTGTPTFLMKLIKEKYKRVDKFENLWMDGIAFDKYDISNLDLLPLLVQTGYLTIKSVDPIKNKYLLSYPNNEVRKSFEIYLLSALAEKPFDINSSLLNDVTAALQNNDIDKFINLLKTLFKGITYPLIEEKESYYHSIFYLVIKLLGFDIETKILTSDGRIDAVIKMETHIYIIEFKLGTAQKAIDQIKEKQYHLKYEADKKELVLLGIGFNVKKKNIGDYITESLIP